MEPVSSLVARLGVFPSVRGVGPGASAWVSCCSRRGRGDVGVGGSGCLWRSAWEMCAEAGVCVGGNVGAVCPRNA